MVEKAKRYVVCESMSDIYLIIYREDDSDPPSKKQFIFSMKKINNTSKISAMT